MTATKAAPSSTGGYVRNRGQALHRPPFAPVRAEIEFGDRPEVWPAAPRRRQTVRGSLQAGLPAPESLRSIQTASETVAAAGHRRNEVIVFAGNVRSLPQGEDGPLLRLLSSTNLPPDGAQGSSFSTPDLDAPPDKEACRRAWARVRPLWPPRVKIPSHRVSRNLPTQTLPSAGPKRPFF